jgi:hypothetical protein
MIEVPYGRVPYPLDLVADLLCIVQVIPTMAPGTADRIDLGGASRRILVRTHGCVAEVAP